MSSLCRLLYWVAAAFFLCEVSIRSLGLPFTNDEDDGGKTFGDLGDNKKLSEFEDDEEYGGKLFEDDGHKLFGVDGDIHKLFGDKDDGQKLFRVNGDEHKLFRDEGNEHKLFEYGDDGDEVYGDKFFEDGDDGYEYFEDHFELFEVEDYPQKVLRIEDDAHKSHEVQKEEDNKAYKVEDDDVRMPPINSTVPVGLRGYRRYFANDSLIGRPVPCTRDDKICFRHNLVFDPITDRCKALWETCREGKSVTVVNRTELEHGSGRVVGSCSGNDWQCSGYLSAYDGICYEKKIMREVICGSDAKLTQHILGGMECRVQPSSLINVQQPTEDGSCLIPDLNHPDPRRSKLLDDPFPFQFRIELDCGSNQAACFSGGKVFVAGYDGCHALLERGPCAEDHVVALSVLAATEGRAEGKCVHVRGGCPKGHKRMLFDSECHEDREIQLVAPGEIGVDQFGRYLVSDWSTGLFFNTAFDGNRTCIIQVLIPTSPPEFPLNPPCGSDNSGKCKLYEVESDPPKPDFDNRK